MNKLLTSLLLVLTMSACQAQESSSTQTATKETKTMSNPRVLLQTSKGDITLELNAEAAPLSVANFLQYVEDKHYDGTVFHRVISGFMVQGGGFDEQYKQKATRASVQNEAKNGLKNSRGSIAMARTSDPHSASTQFFINHKDNDNLDFPSFDGWGYAVFGQVVEGMDVVDAIASVQTGPIPPFGSDVPTTPIVINSATLLDGAKPAE